MITVAVICSFILCFIASMLNNENADSLISGLNTMSDQKKKNFDIPGYVRLFKKVHYAMAACLLIAGILSHLLFGYEVFVRVGIFIFSSFYLYLFYAGAKYNRNELKLSDKITAFIMYALFITGILFAFLMPEIA